MWVKVDFLCPLPPRTRNRFDTDLFVFKVCLHRKNVVQASCSSNEASDVWWWLLLSRSCGCGCIVTDVGVAVHDRPTNDAVLVYNNNDDGDDDDDSMKR